MNKKIINTDLAPSVIGTYSQAVSHQNIVYISGQIPLNPKTMEVVDASFEEATHQVFKNLKAVANAAGCDFSDTLKLTIYLTDLQKFNIVNEIMSKYFLKPYPARAAVEVSALPKNVPIEIDAILALP